jgi:predicted NUDIX family NTP pyrophosphohydrolase
MVKRSAGLLMYRLEQDEVEVFLVHPGGPYWAGKDQGFWTIPKGEYGAMRNLSQQPNGSFSKRQASSPTASS